MGLCSLVSRRDGIYTFRKRVPDDLQGILGKKTIKRSLETANPNEAKLRRTQVEAEVMELFARKRAELSGTPYTPLITLNATTDEDIVFLGGIAIINVV